VLAALAATACESGRTDIALSKPVEADDGSIPKLPVPPENGPQLHALVDGVKVLERPADDAKLVGELLMGSSVARAREPYRRTEGCAEGYYPIRPAGFVCARAGTSLDAGIPMPAPDTSRALPLRYGLAKTATPVYGRPPSAQEQAENEPDLDKHFARADREQGKELRMAANDVPLDERGVPSGPPVIAANGDGVTAGGARTAASWFDMGDVQLPILRLDRLDKPLVVKVLRRGSGVGLVGTLSFEGPRGPRRFGMLPDGSYVPVDRLDPALGSTWHGVDLSQKSLPMAFVLRHETCPYSLAGSDPERLVDEEVDRRSPLQLSGRFRTVGGQRFEEGEDGRWWRERDLVKLTKRSKFPDFVGEGTRWIDVSLALQTLVLYEGKKPVYATLISSGRDVLGDPESSAATVRGTFSIGKKSHYRTLDPREVGETHEVLDAPWSLEFTPGFAFVGSYWADHSGEARGFHDIALAPIDARRLHAWAGPEIPKGFAWFEPGEDDAVIVHVRK